LESQLSQEREARERAEAALEAVKKDREYQKLSGGLHFTSASTEYEWKRDSARKAWALVDEVLAQRPPLGQSKGEGE
jgi:hypothetical protein